MLVCVDGTGGGYGHRADTVPAPSADLWRHGAGSRRTDRYVNSPAHRDDMSTHSSAVRLHKERLDACTDFVNCLFWLPEILSPLNDYIQLGGQVLVRRNAQRTRDTAPRRHNVFM